MYKPGSDHPRCTINAGYERDAATFMAASWRRNTKIYKNAIDCASEIKSTALRCCAIRQNSGKAGGWVEPARAVGLAECFPAMRESSQCPAIAQHPATVWRGCKTRHTEDQAGARSGAHRDRRPIAGRRHLSPHSGRVGSDPEFATASSAAQRSIGFGQPRRRRRAHRSDGVAAIMLAVTPHACPFPLRSESEPCHLKLLTGTPTKPGPSASAVVRVRTGW
jgi:hypothetical protein